MSGRIANIETAVPQFRYQQAELLPYMVRVHQADELMERQLRLLYTKGGIESRHSVVEDFRENAAQELFIGDAIPSIDQRLSVFRDRGVALAHQVASATLLGQCKATEITHLITVSCTGIFAPGLEFQLIKSLGMNPSVQRHPINFVGCYAAIPALKLAHMICGQTPNARVLIVSLELCTLHFQSNPSRDNLLANALFSDGAAGCLVVGNQVPLQAKYRTGSQHGEVHSDGESEMTWTPSEKGFLMRLSSYVPKIIHREIKDFVERALTKAKLKQEEVDWAFHPGGIQILQKTAEALEIDQESLSYSYKALQHYGNMSSATIFFVLKDIMDKAKESRSRPLFCCAFGPGLTFESIVLNHV